MLTLTIIDISLPLTNPVLKFLVILLVILVAPIILNKMKIPGLLGLIVAGAIIGPNGFNLILRDSSIILSGTAGLLYIMFLAGLEIDLADFRKNAGKSTALGLYGFIIPMMLGTAVGRFLLEFSWPTSFLLASLFSSHTLITYPVVSRFGIIKNLAVNITVGSTMITNTLALLVLAIVVGMSTGDVNTEFWIRLSVSLLVGYNIILGHTEAGEPIRLLNDSVLNGSIVMILITCTIAAFATQKGARNIALSTTTASDTGEGPTEEKILISEKQSPVCSEGSNYEP